jgi:hypothetical protein
MNKLDFIKNNKDIVNIFNNIESEYISYFNYLLIDTNDKNKLINIFNKIILLKKNNNDILNNIDKDDIDFIYELITNDKYKNIIIILLDIPNKYNQINNLTYYIKLFYGFINICLITMYILILYRSINFCYNNKNILNIITVLSYIQLFNIILIHKNIINVIIKFVIINLQYVPFYIYMFILSLIIGRLFIYFKNSINDNSSIDDNIYKRYKIILSVSLVILFNTLSIYKYYTGFNTNIAFVETIFYLFNKLFSNYYNIGNTFPNIPKTKIGL